MRRPMLPFALAGPRRTSRTEGPNTKPCPCSESYRSRRIVLTGGPGAWTEERENAA
jgi:hypothetical protein